MENVEFRKRQLNKVVLSADFRPPRSKRVARPARSELFAPPEASCSPRPKRVARPARSELFASLEARQHLCPERGGTPVPNETVPLPRARQYLCPERGGTSDLWRQGDRRAGGQEGRRTGNVYIVLLKVCFCKDSCRSL